MPWAGKQIALAGKPSRFGGSALRVAGWAALVGGFWFAVLLGVLVHLLAPGSQAALVLGLATMTMAAFVGWGLLRSGRALKEDGAAARKATLLQALEARALVREGRVTAADAAGALGIGVGEADALLSGLAKDPDGHVSVEVSDAGELVFLFAPFTRVRFAPEPVERVRFDDDPAEEAYAPAAPASEERHRR